MTEVPLPSWFITSQFIEGPATLLDQSTDAAVVELLNGGLDAITMRTVADRIRCDPSTLHHAFGGRVGFRHAVVARFAARYANWLRGARGAEIVRLPLYADELHAVRVWAALTELAAGEARAGRSGPIEAISAANAAEGECLAWRLEMAPSDLAQPARSALLASAQGARSAMADPINPLPRSAALALVDATRAQFIQ